MFAIHRGDEWVGEGEEERAGGSDCKFYVMHWCVRAEIAFLVIRESFKIWSSGRLGRFWVFPDYNPADILPGGQISGPEGLLHDIG